MKISLPAFDVQNTIERVCKSVNIMSVRSFYSQLDFRLSYSVGLHYDMTRRCHEGLVQYCETNLDLTRLRRELSDNWREDIGKATKFHFARIAYFVTRSPVELDGKVDFSKYIKYYPDLIPNWHFQLLRILNSRQKTISIPSFGLLLLDTVLSQGFISSFTDQNDPDIRDWTDKQFRVPKYQHLFSQLKTMHNEFEFVSPVLTQYGDSPYAIGHHIVQQSIDGIPKHYVLDSGSVTRTTFVYSYFMGCQLILAGTSLNQCSIDTLYNFVPENRFSESHFEEVNKFMWGISWPTLALMNPGDIPPGQPGGPGSLPPGFDRGPKSDKSPNEPSPSPTGRRGGPGDAKSDAKDVTIGRIVPSAPSSESQVIISPNGKSVIIEPYPEDMAQVMSMIASRNPTSFDPLRSHSIMDVPDEIIDVDSEIAPRLELETRTELSRIASGASRLVNTLATVAADPRTTRVVLNGAQILDSVNRLNGRQTLLGVVRNSALRRIRNYAVQQARLRLGLG